MAQLDFPPNPQLNDTYVANGVTYTWDGNKWDGAVIISGGSNGSSDFSTAVTAPSYEADNTGTDTVLFTFQRSGADQFQITTEPSIDVIQPLDLRLPDDSALPFRIMEGTNEYLRVTTTDDAELFDFKKPVKTSQVLTLSNIVTCDDAQDIQVQDAKGTALRILNAAKTGNAAEIFRFNTNEDPTLADFSCDVKFDKGVQITSSSIDIPQDCNILMDPSSSNALDIVPSDATGTFGLRFNTNQEQLITDYDYVNDNNDGIIQLGGTTAAPLLKLVGDGTATFNGAITAGLFQQAGSPGYPANSGTSHFYSDVSIGFTGSQSQLQSNAHVCKFTIQRNFAGHEGGLIVKGGRPGEAANGTQNILAVHYQDVVAGDDIRYHGAVGNANSLQTKTSVNNLIDAKVNPTAISSNSTSVTISQPATISSTLSVQSTATIDQLNLTNHTGTSQLPSTPVVGTIAMFAGIMYYYGVGNQWYMFGTSNNQPPS